MRETLARSSTPQPTHSDLRPPVRNVSSYRPTLDGGPRDATRSPRAGETTGDSPGPSLGHTLTRYASVRRPVAPPEAANGEPIQMMKIVRHGIVTDVPDNYVLQPGEGRYSEAGGQLRRRATEANRGIDDQVETSQTGEHPPGRPYMATRDDPQAHGPVSWASTALMMATGTVDYVALRNATRETKAHLARAELEQAEGYDRNAGLSRAQAAVSAAQATTATPLGHHLTEPIQHATLSHLSENVPNPYGDVGWYSGHDVKDRLQRRKDKQKKD